MSDADNGRAHSSEATPVDIQTVRSRLVDKGLLYFAVVVPLALGLSLTRIA